MNERQTSVVSIISAFAIGGLIGASVALLMAPMTGADTRKMLIDRGGDIVDRAGDIRDKAVDTMGDTRDKAVKAINNVADQTKKVADQTKKRASFISNRSRKKMEKMKDCV